VQSYGESYTLGNGSESDKTKASKKRAVNQKSRYRNGNIEAGAMGKERRRDSQGGAEAFQQNREVQGSKKKKKEKRPPAHGWGEEKGLLAKENRGKKSTVKAPGRTFTNTNNPRPRGKNGRPKNRSLRVRGKKGPFGHG